MARPGGPYDAAYYARYRTTGRSSADAIAPLLVQHCRPASVVDVGCGEGYFLDAFAELGVPRRLGIDAPSNDGVRVREGGHEHRTVDLRAAGLGLDERFDLALCLEVAEHLPAERARALVDELARAAPVIAFSAAVPGQPGVGHVTCRRQSAWAAEFARHALRPVDVVRPRVWDDDRVSWWYRQNLLVYERGEPGPPLLLDVLHPEADFGLRHAATTLADGLRRRFRRRAT